MFDIAHLSKFVVNFNLLILSKPKCIVISTDLFSSPEHEVLMVSYCDQSLSSPSSVHCQLFALNDFFYKTAGGILKYFYRKVPWVTLYQNCSNRSAPLNKMAARAKNRITYQRLLLQNQKMNFEIIIQECFLGDPSTKIAQRILLR